MLIEERVATALCGCYTLGRDIPHASVDETFRVTIDV